jgi:hypothetical protein
MYYPDEIPDQHGESPSRSWWAVIIAATVLLIVL